MDKAAQQQISSKLYFSLATLLSAVLILVLFSMFFFFPMSESSPFLLTVSIALLSTVFLVTFSKKEGSLYENQTKDKLKKEDLQQSLAYVTQIEATQLSETVQKHEKQDESQSVSSFPSASESSNGLIKNENVELNAPKHEYQGDMQSDPSLPSDSVSSTNSTVGEIFELDQYRDQKLENSACIDSENDDDEEEDSLIEINLPCSHDSSNFTEEPEQKLATELPDFLPESIFTQQGLLELLAEINEMNEDESLIEIDISMGSTKCQDLRLKQELEFLGEQCVPSD